MKKIIVITLLLGLLGLCMPVFAADWSKFASGRGAIRLEGSHGQAGYIEFQDGDGNTTGYMWFDATYGPVWSTPTATDLTTRKINDADLILGTTGKVMRRISTSYTSPTND